MSKLYVTVDTDAIRTTHTARGHHWAEATVQSWDGSIQLSMDEQGNVDIRAEQGSTATPGILVLTTTLADLLEIAAQRLAQEVLPFGKESR